MSRYKYLLVDADDTVFDFCACEKNAFIKSCISFGIENGEDVYSDYHDINDGLWKLLELGEITRDKIKTERFRILFERTGILDTDKTDMFAERYMLELCEQRILIDGSFETCETLSKKYKLYIITNGLSRTQHSRLFMSPIIKFFTDVFISEEMGCAKPEKKYFEKVINSIGDSDLSKYLIVGDSPTSDILGAKNIGIDSCLIRRERANIECNATYTVDWLPDVLKFL